MYFRRNVFGKLKRAEVINLFRYHKNSYFASGRKSISAFNALKTGGVERQGRDFQDVVGLLRAGNMAVRSAEVRTLFDRYGTMEWYEKTVAALSR